MPVYDTGLIENRKALRTRQLIVRLSNGGREPAIASVQAYTVNSDVTGFGAVVLYSLNLFYLLPTGFPHSVFTQNLFADLDNMEYG
jgi:hypothetical protein